MNELALGRLGGSHGLDGRIKFISFSGETEHLVGLTEATLKSAERSLVVRIESVQPGGDGALLKIAGYDSPEAVRVLSGMELWAPRDRAAPLQADQYYYADLVGASVRSGSDVVGTVIGVCEGGGGDLLELRRPDGSSVYVPFRKEFIGSVDVAAATIELIAPWILE